MNFPITENRWMSYFRQKCVRRAVLQKRKKIVSDIQMYTDSDMTATAKVIKIILLNEYTVYAQYHSIIKKRLIIETHILKTIFFS